MQSSFVDCSKQLIDLNRAIGNHRDLSPLQLIATCPPLVENVQGRSLDARESIYTQMPRKWTKTKSLLFSLLDVCVDSVSSFVHFFSSFFSACFAFFLSLSQRPAISRAFFSSSLTKRVLPEMTFRVPIRISPIIDSDSMPFDARERSRLKVKYRFFSCCRSGNRTINMERWTVYALVLQIFAVIARAAEDFRHISYEGKN